MGAFGGSYLNHQYLICACAPVVPNVDASSGKSLIRADRDRLAGSLRAPDTRSQHAGFGACRERRATSKTVRWRPRRPTARPSPSTRCSHPTSRAAIRRQPMATRATRTRRPEHAGAAEDGHHRRPARRQGRVVGLVRRRAGRKPAAARRPRAASSIAAKRTFQPHHQPFNYYAELRLRSVTKTVAACICSTSTARSLPMPTPASCRAVAFYKPQGNLNQHAGYANVADGDAHIADVIERLKKSPQWSKHADRRQPTTRTAASTTTRRVPKGDRWGPGSRVPAIIVSPLAKQGFVDKTPYDTASILRFITRRWNLEPLPGVVMRDQALAEQRLRADGRPERVVAHVELSIGPGQADAPLWRRRRGASTTKRSTGIAMRGRPPARCPTARRSTR